MFPSVVDVLKMFLRLRGIYGEHSVNRMRELRETPMTAAVNKARSYVHRAPAEALSDAAGLLAICVMVFAGFTLPALF